MGTILSSLGRIFERKTLSGYDEISTISPQMAALAEAKHPARKPAHVLRNWADEMPEATSAEIANMRALLRVPDGKIALYSGNLAHKQGWEVLVAAARHTAHAHPEIQWLICA